MKVVIPHFGMRRISDNSLMMGGDGRFITSPNKEVVCEYIAANKNSDDFKVSEFTATEVYLTMEQECGS